MYRTHTSVAFQGLVITVEYVGITAIAIARNKSGLSIVFRSV